MATAINIGIKSSRVISSLCIKSCMFHKYTIPINIRTICHYRPSVFFRLYGFKYSARSITTGAINKLPGLVSEGHAYNSFSSIPIHSYVSKRNFKKDGSFRLYQSEKGNTNTPDNINEDSSKKVQGTLGFLGLKDAPKPLLETDPNSKEESQKDKWYAGKNAWKLGLGFLLSSAVVMFGNLLYIYGSPKIDDDGNIILDEFDNLPTGEAYIRRMWKELLAFKQMIQDPSRDKLLPDPLKEPYYQPPYTLVLEMTGVLVHPDWTLGTGWRFKKRPGLDYFLQQVGPPLFEVVIYTREQLFTAFPVINGIDPNGYISYRLFRDATRYKDGTHVKDLSCLNRDMDKIIIVDCDPAAYKDHFRNAIGLQKWSGEDTDTKLVDLAHFLKTIGSSGVPDVRTVLDHYNQFDDPVEAFKENQIKLQMQQEEMRKQQQNTTLVNKFTSGFLGRRR